MKPLPEIRRGLPADLPPIFALLLSAGLPTADLKSVVRLDVWVLEAQDSLAGVVALERHGPEGLLRSLAVAPEYRTRGFGSQLVDRVEDDARADGITQLVLLTETAEKFFRGRGYDVIDRESVSQGLKLSAQFRSLCPVPARCMSKVLAKPT